MQDRRDFAVALFMGVVPNVLIVSYLTAYELGLSGPKFQFFQCLRLSLVKNWQKLHGVATICLPQCDRKMVSSRANSKGSIMQAIAAARFSPPKFTQIETRFDPEYGVLWGFMDPKPRPTFNTLLLSEARDFARGISDSGGVLSEMGQEHTINYVIEASKVPGVYNLGGDLALFRDAISRQDRELLLNYGRACIDNVFSWATSFGLPITTIALVEGDAMGGGFESALSASVLIAEESARLGFPEILFNLFPGMGAYSLLSRKVGRRTTEEMINSGNMYTGRQLYDMGVVDVVAPDGAGEAAVYSYIKKHARAANGRRAIEAARREVVTPLTYDELSRVVTIWVDAALRLTDRDIRMMERLVRAQNRNVDLEVVPSNVMPLQRSA